MYDITFLLGRLLETKRLVRLLLMSVEIHNPSSLSSCTSGSVINYCIIAHAQIMEMVFNYAVDSCCSRSKKILGRF